MTTAKVVALGRTPLVGSRMENWIDESLKAKYGASFFPNNKEVTQKRDASTSNQNSKSK